MAKTRNKITHYDKDLHIRIHGDYLELLRKEAEEKGVTNALMARTIIEDYFKKKEEEHRIGTDWVNVPTNLSFPTSYLSTATNPAEEINARLQREAFNLAHDFVNNQFERNIFDRNTINHDLFH